MLKPGLLIAAILAAGPAIAAFAQENQNFPSIEAAQEFVSTTLLGKGYVAANIRSLADDYYRDKKGMVTIEGAGVIIESSTLARCRSLLMYDGSNILARAGEQVQSVADANPSFRRAGDPNGFNWAADVEKISRIGSDVHVKFASSRLAAVVKAGSISVAARLTEAMQLLHSQCSMTRSIIP